MVWVEDKINNSSNNWTNNAIGITKSWFKKGLKPRCITRDLRWGIRVPLEKFAKKCFYVWFDAPIGYMSITAMYMKNWRDWWMNPDKVELTQFMGKDNVVFHTIFFPTSLLTSNKQWTTVNHLSVTEYLNYGEKKFSKSKGIGVFGSDLKDIDNITIDQWRYYLLSVRPEKSDSVFSWEEFAAKNNNDLKNNIGNFINRILGFLYKRNKGEVPMINLDLLDK